MENTQSTAMEKALRFIGLIADNMPQEAEKDLQAIQYALEDGELLGKLGAKDTDTEMVELAHSYVLEKLQEGFRTLEEVQKQAISKLF